MADWVVCPSCQLRHSRRPDGVCPRCHGSLDGAAAEPPPAAAAAPPAAPAAVASTAGLGRLAQSARGKELKNARGILLFVGIMSALVNGYFFASARQDVQAEIDKELAQLKPGFVVDQDKLEGLRNEAVRTARLVNGAGMVLGIVFVVCALLVQSHPVPATVTGLVLYLGGNAVFGLLNPASLGAGLIVKIIIVVGLFKAVQAAIAYQKELATGVGT